MQDQHSLPIRVWDLPTRLFHWALAILVAALVFTGLTGRLDLHMLMGQAVLALVLFRVVWGFIGNRYARFSDFLAGPGPRCATLPTCSGPPANGITAIIRLGATLCC